MCCTLEPAELSNTILYAAEANVNGKLVHVLGYQNRAQTRGPNAMILPFPAIEAMGPGNVLDTSSCKHILDDYAEAIRPRSRGMSKGFGYDHDSFNEVQVFDSGRYSVVLAKDARAIPDALGLVPAGKRPALNPAIFQAYSEWYPGWPIALCCFDGAVESEPMLWWYVPRDNNRLFLPALDAHDGKPPVLGQRVSVDHTILFGSTIRPRGYKVHFQDTVDPALEPYLAKLVIGATIKQTMPNGDFWLPVEKIQQMKPSAQRVPPTLGA